MDFFIPTLNSGEISDLLAGRAEIQARSYGGSTVENFIPTPQGPLISRSGTQYISGVYDSTKKTHLIGLNAASGTNYIVEASQYVFRYFTGGALVSGGNNAISTFGDTAAVTVTSASPAVITWNNHRLPLYSSVKFTASVSMPTGMTSGTTYYVSSVTKNTFTISDLPGGTDIDTTSTGSGVSGFSNLVKTTSNHSFNNNDIIRISGATGATPLSGDFCVKNVAGDYSAVTMTNANPCVVTWTGHGLAARTPIVFINTTGSSLPSQITAGTTYYVRGPIDADTFCISESIGGTKLSTAGGGGAGTHAARTIDSYLKYFELHTINGAVDDISGNIDYTSYSALAGSPVAAFAGTMHCYSESNMFDSSNRFDIGYQTVGDTIFFAHTSSWPRKLTVSSSTSWEFLPHKKYQKNISGTLYYNFDDGPWDTKNTDSDYLVYDQTAGGLNGQTWILYGGKYGGAGALSSSSVFTDNDVGRLIRSEQDVADYTDPSTTLIRTYTSSSQVSGTLLNTGGHPAPHTGWRKSLFHSSTGYPYRVCFYQDRSCYAGMTTKPTRIEMSCTGNYTLFRPTDEKDITTIADSNAISFEIPSSGTGKILWAVGGGKSLMVGCQGGVYSVSGSESGILAPGKIGLNPVSTHGVANIPPVQAGGVLYYAENGGTRLRTAVNLTQDTFDNSDMTRLCPNILDSGAICMAITATPFPTIWIVRSDGKLVSFVVDEKEKIFAFSRHQIGGAYSGGDAVVESVASVKSTSFNDELWMVVKRTVNGSTVRYVEKMAKNIYSDYTVTQNTAVTADCAYVYNSSAVTNVPSGALNHLIGQTVDVVADGVILSRTVNGSGQFSTVLSTAASVIVVGLSFRPKFETTNIEAYSDKGSTVGKRKRINECDIGFYRTLGAKAGRDSSNMNEIDFGAYSVTAQSLFTGVKKIKINGIETETARVRIEQLIPAPICITFLNPKGEVHG
jgi:hypothetical protein